MQLSASDEAIPCRSMAKTAVALLVSLLPGGGCTTPAARATLCAEHLMASIAPKIRGSKGAAGLLHDEQPASKQIATPARATLTAGA
jgi:hypothetical protein